MSVDSSLSGASWKKLDANPAKEGKHIDASTPLRFMSRTRSSTSCAPGRISAYAEGSKPHSSLGHDTTALSPEDPADLPWKVHCSIPSTITTFGALSL